MSQFDGLDLKLGRVAMNLSWPIGFGHQAPPCWVEMATLAGEGPGLLVFDEPDTSESSFLADPVFTRRISKRKTQLPETCS
jgi:hypothetical protein